MYLWQKSKRGVLLLVCTVVTLAVVVGCSHQQTVNKGEEAMKHGNWDAAVYYYLEALANDPQNLDYRIALLRARQLAGQEHFQRGVKFREIGRLQESVNELRMAVQLDPTHQYAAQVLERVQKDLEILEGPNGTEALANLKRQAREAKVKPPVLDPKSKEPITLNFPKPKPVKEIYKAMAKAYGFNVLFDPKLKDNDLTIELNEVTAERALEITMQAAGHFYKVLDEHSIIIVEDTPQNRREYEDLVIKTFFLSNAEVKDVDKLLRSLIEARRLATNEQLNAITLRDTADKVAIAEKLISVNDKAKAEVSINVELLEVDTSNLEEIGTELSTQSFSLIPDLGLATDTLPPGDGSLYLPDVGNLGNSSIWSINIPSVIINLVKSSSEATLLAQPQMRITEGEKGALIIGDRIPIPMTTFNTANSIGSSVVPITSFQYQDVGIKINVEPRVHHNREVTLKVEVEVSRVSGVVEQNNTSQPIIGTRNINTVIRLKEGETNVLVGLYKEEATYNNQEIPWLSKIPLIGRLFTNKSSDIKTQDLVLTLTPHIVRFPDITEEDLAPVWVGTESRISFFGSRSPRVQSGRTPQGPFDDAKRGREEQGEKDSKAQRDRASSAYGSPALRRGGAAIRRPAAEQPPGGIDLVPGTGGKSGLADPWDDGTDDTDAMPPDQDLAPVMVGLEPSVVSLQPGESGILQLVVSGGSGSYRLPLGVTFNPDRLAITGVEGSPSVIVADRMVDAQGGWLGLDLLVSEASGLPQVAVQLQVQGLEPGPASLVLTSGGATSGDGTVLPVAASDGAVFVAGGGAEK